MTRLMKLIRLQRRLGVWAGLRWWLLRSEKYSRLRSDSRTVSIHPAFLQHPVAVRMRTSDPKVFDQLFVSRELGFIDDLTSPINVIMDLGANVGYASAFLLSAFPQARLVAVEPDEGNLKICRQNLAPYGDRAKVIAGAVWNRRCQLVLTTFGDGLEWGIQVRPAEPGEAADVEAWDIPGLLEAAHHQSVDLLKIDIEGSEKALFSSETDRWLDRVRNICIELHGKDCEDAVFHALRGIRVRRAPVRGVRVAFEPAAQAGSAFRPGR